MGIYLSSLEATLIRVYLLILYAPIAWLAIRRVFPGLLPIAKGLAAVMLAAQVAVILASLEILTNSPFDVWLLHLNAEYNLQATLASTQLFLVSCAAFMSLKSSYARKTPQRLFLAAVGGLFFLFALDESLKLHEQSGPLQAAYILLGAVLFVSACFLAIRAPKQIRPWYACFAVGLALFGIGSLIIDQLKHGAVCASLAIIGQNNCLWRYHVEEPLEFLGAWLALVAMLGFFSEYKPTRPMRLALCILPALWTIVIVYSYPLDAPKLPVQARPAFAQFESGFHVHGYSIGSRGNISLYTHLPRNLSPAKLGYSLILSDLSSGQPIASVDKYLKMSLEYKATRLNRDYWPLFRQYSSLQVPPNYPANRAISVSLAHWREQAGDFLFQRIVSSNHQLLSDRQIILTEFVMPAMAPPPTDTLAVFSNGFALEYADLPRTAQAGQALPIRFAWRADAPGQEDHSQFLHLGHVESGEWWVYDQEPLGSRLPTRLWYSGLSDAETWQAPLPADLAPGQYTVFTGLYRASDQERVPVSDSDARPWLDNRVMLGYLQVE